MTTPLADTTMMSVVHDALRRDMARLHITLSKAPPLADRQRKALVDHVEWMMDFLHHHHHTEDAGLWPLVEQHNPKAGPVLERMRADHAQVAIAVSEVREATQRYRGEATDEARKALAAALAKLSEPLLDHLRLEDDEAVPLVAASITTKQWQAWDKQNNVRGKSIGRLAAEGHWLMDGLDSDRYEVLVHLVPGPIRIVIVKGYARRYRSTCALRWGPELDVAPLKTAR